MLTYLIIPGYNEQKTLGKVITKCLEYTKHIILVDDGSVDRTSQVAQDKGVYVLRHGTNLGKGAALRTGCEYAFNVLKADAVIFMDADDQHDPAELPHFFKALQSSDVVFGVRNMGVNMTLFRFLWNKLVSILLNTLYGVYIPDIPSGYKGLTKRAYAKVVWKSRGYEVEVEICVNVAKNKIPFTIVEIESIYHETDRGMTGIDAFRITKCLLQWKVGL